MYVRVKTRNNTPKKAVQIVKSFREGNKVRQKVIQTIGYAHDQETLDQLRNVAEHLRIRLEIEESTSLFPTEPLIQDAIARIDHSSTNPNDLIVNLSDLRQINTLITGIHQVYGDIYDTLDFASVFPKSKASQAKILKDIVLARLAWPSSKRASVAILNRDFGINLDLNKVYRMMDQLDETIINKVLTESFNATKRILGRNVTIAFYDCTTLYFESFSCDEFKAKGYSKDCKFNQPQVVLSLIITEEGLPLGYHVFPGNTYEGDTLEVAIKELKEKYGLEQITIVADSGLLNKENINLIKTKGYKYILGARLRNITKTKQEEILEGIKNSKERSQSDYITKSYETMYKGERLIARYNSKRGEKDRKDRERSVEKLKEKLEKSEKAVSFLSNYGYKKFLKCEGDVGKVKLNEEKLEKEKEWDGISGVITNLEEESSEKILSHYRDLWQIESCFRIEKHDLKIRPIYHWNEKRIKGHINICYQAFHCQAYLRYRLKLQKYEISTENVRQALVGVRETILKDIKTEKVYSIPSNLSDAATKIYGIMRKKYSRVPIQIG